MNDIRILLVDDDPVVINNLKPLFENHEDMSLVAASMDSFKAKEELSKHRIDIALVDIDMPKISGIELAKYIRDNYGNVKIIIFTCFEHKSSLAKSVMVGVDGFITKETPFNDLIHIIKKVMAGEQFFSEEPTSIMIKEYEKSQRKVDEGFLRSIEGMPERCKPVFDLVIKGYSNALIASKLSISAASVRTYMTEILRVTDSKNRHELTVKAAKSGLI